MGYPIAEPLGYKCEIIVKHKGCWASGLSTHFQAIGRPDLILFVFLLDSNKGFYKVLAVIKSKEKKKIESDIERQIIDYLFNHGIVRALKPNLPKPSSHILPLLVCIEDKEVHGAYRILEDLGAIFDKQIGMLVENGIESVTFFLKDLKILGRALEKYADRHDLYAIYGSRSGKMYTDIDILEDPHYLLAILIDDKSIITKINEAVKETPKQIGNAIRENAWWLIPLLKEVLRWLWETTPTYDFLR